MTRQKPHVAREHESVLADMAQLSSALQEQSCAYKNTFFFCVYFSLSALQRISQIHSVRLDSVIHIATSASFWDLLRIISDACTRLPFLPLSLSNVNWLCPLLSLSAPKRPCSWIAKVWPLHHSPSMPMSYQSYPIPLARPAREQINHYIPFSKQGSESKGWSIMNSTPCPNLSQDTSKNWTLPQNESHLNSSATKNARSTPLLHVRWTTQATWLPQDRPTALDSVRSIYSTTYWRQ